MTEHKWWSPDRRGVGFDDGPPRRGIGDLVAVALIALDLETVRRSTVRALLPSQTFHHETGEPTSNRIGQFINRALRRFERNDWISRDGLFIHVHNRDGLRSWVDQGVDLTDERAARMLNVREAVEQINARLEDGSATSGWDAETARQYAEARRRELIAIQRLMRAAPNASGPGRTGVRIVPAARVL